MHWYHPEIWEQRCTDTHIGWEHCGMDYATLLTKYIAYIADCEGIDDIEPIDLRDSSAVSFTDDEWQALQAIHAAQARATDTATAVEEVWSIPDEVGNASGARGSDEADG
jgi:hypothetical protein